MSQKVQALRPDMTKPYDPNRESRTLKREVTKFQKAALTADPESHLAVGAGTDFL
jgi:hypothetical protein